MESKEPLYHHYNNNVFKDCDSDIGSIQSIEHNFHNEDEKLISNKLFTEKESDYIHQNEEEAFNAYLYANNSSSIILKNHDDNRINDNNNTTKTPVKEDAELYKHESKDFANSYKYITTDHFDMILDNKSDDNNNNINIMIENENIELFMEEADSKFKINNNINNNNIDHSDNDDIDNNDDKGITHYEDPYIPLGWTKYYDSNYNTYYYAHNKSGETQWECPIIKIRNNYYNMDNVEGINSNSLISYREDSDKYNYKEEDIPEEEIDYNDYDDYLYDNTDNNNNNNNEYNNEYYTKDSYQFNIDNDNHNDNNDFYNDKIEDERIILLEDRKFESNKVEGSVSTKHDYYNMARLYRLNRKYCDPNYKAVCVLCHDNYCVDVFFPCEHRCVWLVKIIIIMPILYC